MPNDSMNSPLKEIVLRAWIDPTFKQRLMSDPKAVFSEFGLNAPTDDTKLNVVENSADEVYFVLPEAPEMGELSDEEIRTLVDSALGEQLVLPTILAR